ncbi:MAG: hypothetical protein FJ255_00730 [Phycisphaerae bacterium]|nr:hypothetical protein [Phycisphaerae bacterium]
MRAARKLAAIGACVLSALLGACQARIAGPFPKEVVIEVETRAHTIVFDQEAERPPDYVPLITMHQGRRHEGLLLIPGSGSWGGPPFHVRHRGTLGGYSLRVPQQVRRSHEGVWDIDFAGSISMTSQAVEAAAHTPIPVRIPVTVPIRGIGKPRIPLEGEIPRLYR